nr:retrotransposon protein, putative, Ty1-copia subclass [Tanacetum cinerariifolium]
MVRSMMNLTTLPLSFWNYALGSAIRILNMVPTKKVDKTPYELCGRAVELEEIQDEDTLPSENTSEILTKVEGFEPRQEDEAHVHSSLSTEKEAIHLILTGIGDKIYSTVDSCKTAQEMWEAIKRLQHGESLNIQDLYEIWLELMLLMLVHMVCEALMFGSMGLDLVEQ